MARPRHQFTVYDAMEHKGVFDANPANPQSRDLNTGESLYKGPVEFPKMLYHPLGDEVVIVPAEIVVTPLGPQRVGEQRRIIHRKVDNSAEESELRAEGWHDHPAKAIAARLKSMNLDPNLAPPVSADSRIKELEEQLRRMQAEKSDLQAKMLSEARSSGKALGVKQVTGKEPSPPPNLAELP